MRYTGADRTICIFARDYTQIGPATEYLAYVEGAPRETNIGLTMHHGASRDTGLVALAGFLKKESAHDIVNVINDIPNHMDKKLYRPLNENEMRRLRGKQHIVEPKLRIAG